MSDNHFLNRIRAEFMEMPGLRLTPAQLQRLCGVEAMTCEIALAALVDAKFLIANPDGTYGRLTDGDVQRPRPAKAALSSKRHVNAS